MVGLRKRAIHTPTMKAIDAIAVNPMPVSIHREPIRKLPFITRAKAPGTCSKHNAAKYAKGSPREIRSLRSIADRQTSALKQTTIERVIATQLFALNRPDEVSRHPQCSVSARSLLRPRQRSIDERARGSLAGRPACIGGQGGYTGRKRRARRNRCAATWASLPYGRACKILRAILRGVIRPAVLSRSTVPSYISGSTKSTDLGVARGPKAMRSILAADG